jgi:mannose-6-phosphate isomerase-like protein (cupin superfamily)
MRDWLVPLEEFEANLGRDGKRFWVGLRHGTMSVELFAPQGRDTQQPHARDELYIVLRGTGTFSRRGEVRLVSAGDVIFVPAGAEHRFETFSDDFATWVIFWGPEGGEKEEG